MPDSRLPCQRPGRVLRPGLAKLGQTLPWGGAQEGRPQAPVLSEDLKRNIHPLQDCHCWVAATQPLSRFRQEPSLEAGGEARVGRQKT